MSRIKLLPEEVASQVAAGEVIERPASVVKELVENSLDAHAERIEVMVHRGGRSLIRVVDNGIGMNRDDALLCLERHATSKIRTGADLASISTLGFRGEALPSIASVSRFRLATRESGAIAGTEVLVSGGKLETVRDGGDAPGTQIEVRQLFFNLPARRKFLRSENTESSHVEHQIHLQAIGHPEVGFVFVNNGRLAFQLPPASSLRERIRDLTGERLAGQLIEVESETVPGLRISGLIGKAGVSRSNRAQQIIFLNGRVVENATLTHALREGYHTALMKGQFPVTFLSVQMNPAAVDVNVHPAKREVRFRDPVEVREAVVEAIRRAIESDRRNWSRQFESSATGSVETESRASRTDPLPERRECSFSNAAAKELIPHREQIELRKDWSLLSSETIAPSEATSEKSLNSETTAAASTAREEEFRILGVLGRLYVLMENQSGLVLVDQHAAHERILFEELRRRMEDQGVPSQRLLMPLTIRLTPRDSDWIRQNLATLHRMGICIESFGSDTFKVDALPQFLSRGDPLQLIRDVIDELTETSSSSSKVRLGEDVIATTVCRHAVKANDSLHEPELVRLIKDLLRCELPYCCPHGRPTMIQISYGELERKFGRRV